MDRGEGQIGENEDLNKSLIMVDLRGYDFFDKNLGNAKLIGSDLRKVNFGSSSFFNTKLINANLLGTELSVKISSLGFIQPQIQSTKITDELVVLQFSQSFQIYHKDRLIKEIHWPRQISSLEVAPDRSFIITGHIDRSLVQWDLATFASTVLAKDAKSNTIVAISPDSKKIIYITKDCENIVKLNLKNNKTRKADSKVFIRSIAYNEFVIIGLASYIIIMNTKLVEVKTVTIPPKLRYLMSPDGNYIADCFGNGTVISFHVETMQKKQYRRFGKRSTLLFSEDSSMIAVYSNDKMLTIWDINTCELINQLYCHWEILHLYFDRENIKILDRNLKFVEFKLLQKDPFTKTIVKSMAVSLCRNLVAYSTKDKWFYVWDMNSDKIIYSKNSETIRMMFSWKHLISAGSDGMVLVWNIQNRRIYKNLHTTYTIISLACSAGEDLIALGTKQNLIIVWNTRYSERLTLNGHRDWVTALSFIQGLIVSGSRDRTVRVWKESECVNVLSIQLSVSALKPIENTVFLGTDDGWILIFNVNDPDIQRVKLFDKKVKMIDFDSKGNHFISASKNGQIVKVRMHDLNGIKKLTHATKLKHAIFTSKFAVISHSDNTISKGILK